jgi:hypothetical protein
MRPARALASVVVLCALGGCGGTDKDQVRAKVEQFARAAASKDYNTICSDVLAPVLLERLAAGGISCERAMRIGLGGVRSPSVSIGPITVSGSTASVITVSGAKGQEAALTAIKLVRTNAGWRVTSLGPPVLPPRR